MVLRTQRDGLGSASQAPRDRTSGTRGATDVPTVGQRSGAQGPDSEGSAFRSGVWVRGATLTWLHGWAGGAGEGIASSDRTLLPTGERRGGRRCRDCVPCTTVLAPLGTGDIGNCSESLGTTGQRASGGTTQKGKKGFSTQTSTGGRSGLTISWRAGPSVSGSPVPRTPLALALHGPGRGRDGLRHFPAASSTLRPEWRLLLGPRWSKGGGSRRAPSATSGRRGCNRRRGDDSSGPPGQNVSARFCAMENCWAKLSTASPERPAWEIGESRKRCLSDSPISARSSHRSFLYHQSGHRLTEGPRCDFRCTKGKVRRCAQFLHQTWVRTALVQLLQRLGLVGLQEGHGVQGRGGLSSSSVSLGRWNGREPTSPGWEARITLPGGSARGQSCTAIARSTGGISTYPLATPAIEGSEDGRSTSSVSGRKIVPSKS